MIKLKKLIGFKCLTQTITKEQYEDNLKIHKKHNKKFKFDQIDNTNNLQVFSEDRTGNNLRINGTYFHIELTDFEQDITMLEFLNIHIRIMPNVVKMLEDNKNSYPNNKNYYIFIKEDDSKNEHTIVISNNKIKKAEEFINYYKQFDSINGSTLEK